MTWRRTRLKYLAAEPIVNGLGEAARLEDECWPRYIRTTDFASTRDLRDDTLATLPPDLAREADVRRGDILMSAAGTVGKTFLYESDEPACYAGYLVRFRPRRDVDSHFVAYWTETPLFIDQVETGKVTSTIDNFSAGKYQNLEITIPDRATQRTIVDFLDTETARIDALITKKQRLVQLLDQRWQALLEDRIRAAVGEHGDAPLRHLTQLGVGIVITPAKWYVADGVPALRGTNVKPGYLDTSELVCLSEEGHRENYRSRLQTGDIVVVRTGQAGNACVVPPEFDGANCIDVLIIRRSRHFDSKFVEFVLNSDWTQRQVELHSVGSIQSHFNVSALKSVRVPAAPIPTQREIARQLLTASERDRGVRRRLSGQVALLREHRKALITAAVTGELEVPGVAA